MLFHSAKVPSKVFSIYLKSTGRAVIVFKKSLPLITHEYPKSWPNRSLSPPARSRCQPTQWAAAVNYKVCGNHKSWSRYFDMKSLLRFYRVFDHQASQPQLQLKVISRVHLRGNAHWASRGKVSLMNFWVRTRSIKIPVPNLTFYNFQLVVSVILF